MAIMLHRPRRLVRRSFVLLATLLAGATACDDDGDRRPPPTGDDFQRLDLTDLPDEESDLTAPDTTVEPDAPDDGADDTEDGADTIVEPPGGPVVALVSPAEPADLTSAEIVTTARLTVDCRVTPGESGTPVDLESVTLSVSDARGTTLQARGRPTATSSVFSAEFDLSNAVNGTLQLSCEASDLGEQPVSASDTRSTYIDLGPRITVLTPQANAYYSQQLGVFFRVEPQPVSPADTAFAAVDEGSVRVFVGTTELSALSRDQFGNFVGTFDFDDPNQFVPPLDGPALLRIEAANSRSASPVVRTVEVPFVADHDGALIQFVDPAPGSLVGGTFLLKVKVTDPGGVDPNSVFVSLETPGQTVTRALAPLGNDEYGALIDARSVGADVVNFNVQVAARDLAGNLDSNGMVLFLDLQPPMVDLDPPPLREYFASDGSCTRAFDPVGGDAVNDLTCVPQLAEFRAFIEDRGNRATSTGTVIPFAAVDNTTPRLYVLDDESGALLVDTNGDGVCDEINPLLIAGSTSQGAGTVAVVALSPIESRGTEAVIAYDGDPSNCPFEPNSPCCFPPDAVSGAEAGDALCPASTNIRRIVEATIDELPLIYGMQPVTEHNCMGSALDARGRNISEGWACVAVRAADNLGNVGVSPPLRVYFEYGADSACQPGNAPPGPVPDCTGTWDAATSSVDTSRPCTPPPGVLTTLLPRLD